MDRYGPQAIRQMENYMLLGARMELSSYGKRHRGRTVSGGEKVCTIFHFCEHPSFENMHTTFIAIVPFLLSLFISFYVTD
jgi:hypothetical protein